MLPDISNANSTGHGVKPAHFIHLLCCIKTFFFSDSNRCEGNKEKISRIRS